MTCCDVGDLVCQDSRQLRFVCGEFDQAGVHEYIATRQGHRVDLVRIDDSCRDRYLGIRVQGKVLGNAVDELICDRIHKHAFVPFDHGRGLPAHPLFVLDRIEVESFAHTPVADLGHILLIILWCALWAGLSECARSANRQHGYYYEIDCPLSC